MVEEIERGADPEAFARGPAAAPFNQGHSYRRQWWITHNAYGAYYALGYGGQILYIAPAIQSMGLRLGFRRRRSRVAQS